MPPRKRRPKPQRKRTPKPAPAVVVEIMPKPELHPKQRRFFAVVNKNNAIGFWLISIGSAFCLGYLLTDKAHLHEKVVLGIGLVLILFGAHFLSSAPTERALNAVAKTAKDVLPFTRKNDPPGAA